LLDVTVNLDFKEALSSILVLVATLRVPFLFSGLKEKSTAPLTSDP